MEKSIVNKIFLLEKYPGKGGWTYARIDPIKITKKKPFGFIKVKGSIDGYKIQKYHIMPMGAGLYFLPVKAEIRKKIKKSEGDSVHIILYEDNEPLVVPAEMLLCLQDDRMALLF